MPPCQHADRRPDDHRRECRNDADDQRNARAIDQARQRVAAETVGPEPVLEGRRAQLLEDVLIVRIERREHRREDSRNDHDQKDHQPDP